MHDNKDKRNNRFLTLFDISMSDILKVFETDDIFTKKDAISGFKISLWTVQFLLDDITAFNIGFPIPYTLQ
jgi:hypothetical protein